jgi:hypothetical protein
MRRMFWIVLLPLLGPACSGGVELSGDGNAGDDGSPVDASEGMDARDAAEELPDEVADAPVEDGTTDEAGGGVSCAPQEAAGRMCDGGGCATVLGWFWDGHDCFEEVGCECVGVDCDAGSASEAECEVLHATCDGALCSATGGSWFPATAGFCGFTCGQLSELDCFVPMDSCDCGPGRTFLSGTGCPEEPTACDAGFVCRATGGTWLGAPGCYCPYRCGEELPECYACGEVCDCGPYRNFDSLLGCVPDPLCTGAGRETACMSTGGTWHDCTAGDPWCSCGDYLCGRPNVDLPCAMPGCDCGSLRNFDTHRGCVYDATCVLRGPGAECGGGFGSDCRPGLVCCEGCGAPPGCPTCRPPCCPEDSSCMDDGCPVPPP